MDAVFIDTNSIRNEKTSSFFGNIDKYKKISEQVQIIIPSIVIDEIKRQKKRHLKSQLDKFCNNYFAEYFGIDSKEKQELIKHIDDKIKLLYEGANDEIEHIVLDLEHDGKLQKIKELAIKNIPPFEAETDKGFKDSYIYLTVLEYQESATDDVFLITNDSRLKQAFEDSKVHTISTVQEYYDYREEFFKEDYFIEKMKEHFENNEITKENISNIALTADDDWQITVGVNGDEHHVLVDFVSKEIISN